LAFAPVGHGEVRVHRLRLAERFGGGPVLEVVELGGASGGGYVSHLGPPPRLRRRNVHPVVGVNMRRICCIAIVATVGLGLGPTRHLSAQDEPQEDVQEIQSGTWAGVLVPAGDTAADVQFQVASEDDAISITMVIPGFGELPLDDVTLEDETLSFSFDIGLVVRCSLARTDDGGFEGTCTGDDGNSGRVTMTPPAEG